MKPDISEFSYGFALTDELIHWHGLNLTAAPVFPSLFQEGQPGGGYDVRLDRPGMPLFIQFKLSHKMKRRSAVEAKRGLLKVPFYRMHLRPARHSSQHEMLIDLEQLGQEVYYSAPAFHTPQELNEAYLKHEVKIKSLWIKPSVIGALPDDGEHHVAFRLDAPPPHICSEPRRLDSSGSFEEFQGNVIGAFRKASEFGLHKENLLRVASAMTDIAEKHRHIAFASKRLSQRVLEERTPLERVAFYSHVFLDCQLFVVQERDLGKKAGLRR
ncbi:hypothetical protein [Luteolibacter soli]|uniref:DUF4365 domain-containing protein n=1 Tax=Luteolibacter soli TaxID=3135280 RepID=A0ABU9APA6_9BACT